MVTVAVIGADGAGKTTICRAVVSRCEVPLKYVYMGVNLEASKVMLPTTRLLLWSKQQRGLRGDSTFRSPGVDRHPSVARKAKMLVRLLFWLPEEWFRQALAWSYQLRGYGVLFDRHFFADYYAYDVMPSSAGLPLANRVHGFMLGRLYPKPDLFILLNAPAEVLHSRKPEASLEFIRERQSQYLTLRGHVGRFEIVDASQPQESVIREVEAVIREFAGARARPVV